MIMEKMSEDNSIFFIDSGALNEDELRELYGKIGNSFYDNMDDMDDEYLF